MNLEKYKEYILDLYKSFIPIKAIAPENGGEGEWNRAKVLLEKIKDLFDEIKVIEVPDNRVKEGSRPNIIAIKYGKNKNKTFWIVAHMDTVPEGDIKLWKYNPYDVTVEGNKIYGRGVQDNGNGIVIGILVAKILKDYNIVPEFNYGLILASDEEVGSNYGIKYILKNYPNFFKEEDWILVPDAGSKDGLEIEIAEKGILWVKFEVIGRQVHASTPEHGLNSTRLGSLLIIQLDKVLHEKYDKENKLFANKSTFEPTKVEKNVENINTVPGRFVFYFDCRILPDYDLDEVYETILYVCKEFERNYNCKVNVEIVHKDYPSILKNFTNNEFLEKLKEKIKKHKGKDPYIIGIGGGTYAKYFREKNLNAIVWSTYN
ncbi:MAG: M20 family metallo-hydrolase, partial [Nanopusillaceae archaeon]